MKKRKRPPTPNTILVNEEKEDPRRFIEEHLPSFMDKLARAKESKDPTQWIDAFIDLFLPLCPSLPTETAEQTSANIASMRAMLISCIVHTVRIYLRANPVENKTMSPANRRNLLLAAFFNAFATFSLDETCKIAINKIRKIVSFCDDCSVDRVIYYQIKLLQQGHVCFLTQFVHQ